MTAVDTASYFHEVKTRYLQGILVSFLVASATLFLYTTRNDPMLEFKGSKEPVLLPLQQRASALITPQRVRLYNLDVIPLQLVHAEGEDTLLVTMMHPDFHSMPEDTKSNSNHDSGREPQEAAPTRQTPNESSYAARHKAFRRKLAPPSWMSGQHKVRHNTYSLIDNQDRQVQLVNQLFTAAGYVLAAVFVGAVIVNAAVDGDSAEYLTRRRHKEQKACLVSSLTENYGSFDSTDRVSDWSGNYFDRYDV